MSKKTIAAIFFAMGMMFFSMLDSLFDENLLIGFLKGVLLIILFSISYKNVFEWNHDGDKNNGVCMNKSAPLFFIKVYKNKGNKRGNKVKFKKSFCYP